MSPRIPVTCPFSPTIAKVLVGLGMWIWPGLLWSFASWELEAGVAEILVATLLSCVSQGAVPHSFKGLWLEAPNFQSGTTMALACAFVSAVLTDSKSGSTLVKGCYKTKCTPKAMQVMIASATNCAIEL